MFILYSLFTESLFCSSNKNLRNPLWIFSLLSLPLAIEWISSQTSWVLLSMFKISKFWLIFNISVLSSNYHFLLSEPWQYPSNWSWPFPILGPKEAYGTMEIGSGEAVEDNKNKYCYNPDQYLIHLAYFLTLKGNKVHNIFCEINLGLTSEIGMNVEYQVLYWVLLHKLFFDP